jgi:hypothetical protein
MVVSRSNVGNRAGSGLERGLVMKLGKWSSDDGRC